jgi:hypothetical protein
VEVPNEKKLKNLISRYNIYIILGAGAAASYFLYYPNNKKKKTICK